MSPQGGPTRPKSKRPVNASNASPQWVVTGDIQLRATEGRDEKKLRLRKEYLSFLVKDLLIYVVGVLLLIAAAIYAFLILSTRNSPEPDRQFARSLMTALLTGVVAFLFGKSTKA